MKSTNKGVLKMKEKLVAILNEMKNQAWELKDMAKGDEEYGEFQEARAKEDIASVINYYHNIIKEVLENE